MRLIKLGVALVAITLSISSAQAATSGTLTLSSTTHSENISSTNSSISMQWSALTAGVGAVTYEYVLDGTATQTQTTFNKQIDAQTTTATHYDSADSSLFVDLSAVDDGTYYFHMRGYDDDGPLNGSGVVTFGPIVLDSQPAFAASNAVSPATGSHVNQIALTILGSRFMSGATVDLVNGGTTVALTGVTVVSATEITANVPADTIPATYDVKVTNATPHQKWVTLPSGYQSTNTAPVADVGADATVTIQQGGTGTINLDGTASSDADADDIAYLWTVTAAPAGSALVVDTTTYITSTKAVTVSTAGTYTFSLVVNDGFTNSSAATVTYTVVEQNANNPPDADAGAAQLVASSALVTLSGTGTDVDAGDTLTYAWTVSSEPATSAITLSDATVPGPTFTPTVAGDYVLSLVVHDGTADSNAATVVITVNDAPTADAGTAQTAALTQLVTLDGTASSDPEAAALTYAWSVTSEPAGSAITLSSATASQPTFTPTAVGDYVFSLTVTDPLSQASTAASVTITAVNSFTYNYTFTKNAGTTSVTAIGFILSGTGITTASELAAAISNCDLVSRWDPATQAYISHTPSSPFNDFTLAAGEAYFISVSADSVLALTGALPTITCSLAKNAGTTSVTAIGLRQGAVAGGVSTAAGLATAIGANVDLISRWDPATQAYISHTPSSPFNDFNLSDGDAYFISVTQNTQW